MPEEFHHRDRCAIVGIGTTEFSRNSGRSDLTLAAEASLAAIADAGLTPAGHRRHRALRQGRCAPQRPRRRPRADAASTTSARSAPAASRPAARWARPWPRSSRDRRRRCSCSDRSTGARAAATGSARWRTRASAATGPTTSTSSPYGLLTPGPDLRPHRPTPHARVRDQREGPGAHRGGLPQPGQRQPSGPDARPDIVDGRLPGGRG